MNTFKVGDRVKYTGLGQHINPNLIRHEGTVIADPSILFVKVCFDIIGEYYPFIDNLELISAIPSKPATCIPITYSGPIPDYTPLADAAKLYDKIEYGLFGVIPAHLEDPSVKCECGSSSVGIDKHRDYCQLFVKE